MGMIKITDNEAKWLRENGVTLIDGVVSTHGHHHKTRYLVCSDRNLKLLEKYRDGVRAGGKSHAKPKKRRKSK